MTEKLADPSLLTYPMHGMNKLRREGFRTRDAHFIEWFSRLLGGPTWVISRPQPLGVGVRIENSIYDNIVSVETRAPVIPRLTDRRHWWVKSASFYPLLAVESAPAIIWNPFVALSKYEANSTLGTQPVVFDLLDDWTKHYAFSSIRREVLDAYRRIFDTAAFVTANSEETGSLAQSLGRSDVKVVPNGCDPENFSTNCTASGPLTVGYVGKIGQRLDIGLIEEVCHTHPDYNFVFAGPVLDRGYRARLQHCPNIRLLGDVHYEKLPRLLETFDVGWVPHNVGAKEVGGDVLKVYEYRAAGLPVLTTNVAHVNERGLSAVWIRDNGAGHSAWLGALRVEDRPIRYIESLPEKVQWEYKARYLLSLVGLDV